MPYGLARSTVRRRGSRAPDRASGAAARGAAAGHGRPRPRRGGGRGGRGPRDRRPPFDDPLRTNEDERWERDPAFAAVEEAGGGWAEGFEQSEGLLVEHVYNAPEPELTPDGFDRDDPGTDVDPDAEDLVEEELEAAEHGDLPPAEHRDEAYLGAEGGEADELRSTEVTFDPDSGPDDPGRGPGLSWER